MVADSLISAYYSLEGGSRSGKARSLRALLSRVNSELTSEAELSSFIKSLTPRNQLEEAFKVDILIYLRRNADLLEVLKCGKPMLVRKILKHWKFFEDTFRDMDAQTAVEEIFPHTSFGARLKIITRLSVTLRNEERADAYFRAIEGRYGLKIARGILPGCSLDLIKSVVETHNVSIPSRHLLRIVKKHPEFLEFYYERTKSFERFRKFEQPLRYIAQRSTKLFWDFFDKHKVSPRFGKYVTRHLLQNRSNIVNSDRKYVDIFNCRQLFKNVRKNKVEMRQLFLSFYPEEIESFESYVYNTYPLNKFLNYFAKEEQFAVLSRYFKEMYGRDMIEYPDLFSENFLKIMPVTEREIVLDEKVKTDETLVYLFNTRKSIPIIKEHIRHTGDLSTRKGLISQLLRTCEFNKHAGALLYVLKYIQGRHKNDVYSLQCFMTDLNNWPNIELLSSEHWNIINEFLKVLEISGKSCYREDNYAKHYLMHLMENELPYDEEIKSVIVTAKNTSMHHGNFNLKKKYHKRYLERIGFFIIPQDEKLSTKFLLSVIDYNGGNPDDQIPLTNYPEMLNTIKFCVTKDDNFYFKRVVNHCVKLYDEWDLFFWEKYSHLVRDDILIWYIKKRLGRVLEHMKLMLNSTFIGRTEVIHLLRKISHEQISPMLLQFAQESLRNTEAYSDNMDMIPILAYFGTDQQYFDAVEFAYPPADGKINTEDTNQDKIEFQRKIIKNLQHLSSPASCLPVLLRFCKADYLKYSLVRLYSVVINTPENNLPPFFDALFDSAVSVRKHVVFLMSMVSAKEVIYNFMKFAGMTEKNSSLQKAIFRKTVQFFVENPSEMFWDLFTEIIKIIDPNDREAHEPLLDLNLVPSSYLPRFIPIAYTKLSSNPEREIWKRRYELLDSIPDEVLDSLDKDFLIQLISHTYFVPDEDNNAEHFCVKCVCLTSGQKQSDLFEYTFGIFKNYVQKHWVGTATSKVRREISNFVSEFCNNAIASSGGKFLVEQFATGWKSLFETEDAIDEYLLLELTLMYLSCNSEDNVVEFGAKLNAFLLSLVETYDASILDVFFSAMDDFLDGNCNIRDDEESLFKFTRSFFYANQSPYVYIIITKDLCDNFIDSTYEKQEKYRDMYKLVENCKLPIVQLHFKRYIKFMS